MGQMKTEYEKAGDDRVMPHIEPGKKGTEISYEELLARYRELENQVKELRVRSNHENREYKSRLFCFIFGRKEHKEWTLSLYNAINGSSHTDPDDITINTLEDVVYMGMKNDLSFLVSDLVTMYQSLQLYEQQSSYNPNMPIRELMYAGKLYDKHIYTSGLNRYGKTLMPLPIPKLVTLYNGEDERDDQMILELSDAFREGIRDRIRNNSPNAEDSGIDDLEAEVERLYNEADPDISVRVRMININYGRNRELLKSCKPLEEYSWFVAKVREYNKPVKEGANPELGQSIGKAIEEMPDDFQIKELLVENRAEVESMCLTEYDERKAMELFKKEGKAEERVNTEAERKRADAAEQRAESAEQQLSEAEQQIKELKNKLAANGISA